MSKHILVVSQYFYPEQFRINDIAAEWVKRGYKITVLTGIPNYPKGKFYDGYGYRKKRNERYDGVDIIRLPIIPRGNNSIQLIFNYFSFVISGWWWKSLTKIKADYVFTFEVSPMTQALPGIWYAKKLDIPSYLYVTDLWPENVQMVAGINNKFVLKSIRRMVDSIYHRTERIFTSSMSFIHAIANRGISEDKLEFWPQYAEDYYMPLSKDVVDLTEIIQDDVFSIIFAGNIGYAQGLGVLTDVAMLLKQEKIRVRFNMVGDGRFKSILQSNVITCDVDEYFEFIEQQPAIRIAEFMALNDAALICLAQSPVFAITLPSKLQTCMSCGIPLLVSADGEIQDIVRESDSGLCSNAADAEGLAQNIKAMLKLPKSRLDEMGKNAIEYSSENFAKELLLEHMDKWFK